MFLHHPAPPSNLADRSAGTLRIELPKERYERAGLVGKPVPDGGRKHVKTRYRAHVCPCSETLPLTVATGIDINLREPSMVSGKKGFERVRWACKNVLTESVTWLFYDHNAAATLETGMTTSRQLVKAVLTDWHITTGSVPISIHHPSYRTVLPSTHPACNVLIPPLGRAALDTPVDEDDATDLLEWLGLVSLRSPRILAEDKIDPFLSRYCTPWHEEANSGGLVTIRWHGFIPGQWARSLFVQLL
jgi:ribonuclease P/MRP protein subunit RPP40